MTSPEAKKLVAMVAAAWPRQGVAQPTLEAYAIGLGDLDFELANAAVHRLMQTSRFFPTIAEIRDAAVRGRVALPTPEEAWGIVHQAIGRHGSYRVPVFDCDEIQRATDAIGWKEICLAEGDAARAANRARWIEAYKGFVARRLDAEATGRHRIPRELPAASPEPGDVRVLVETGYASSVGIRRPELPAPSSDVNPNVLELVERSRRRK